METILDREGAGLRESIETRSHSAAPRAGWVRRLLLVAVGVVVVSVSARLSATIPGSTVPQSAQTLAVLVVGSLLGARDGALALMAYLILGGVGVPVFAEGGSGWAHLVGPTAGYLLGFVVAAAATGRLADLGVLRRIGPAIAAMVCGHTLILALGWLRLAWALGAASAFWQGVAPFALGAVLKSLLAALTIVIVSSSVGVESSNSSAA